MASRSRSISKGSEEVFLYECDPCKYQKITSEAKAYCIICTEYLCTRCEQAHKGSRATRDHKILTGRDIHSGTTATKQNLPVMYCEIHKAMTLNSFCKSHDDVICDTCRMTDHRKCTITDVSNQTKNVKVIKTLDEALKSLRDLKIQYEMVEDSRRADKDKVKTQLGKCLDDMRKVRKEINRNFDKLERKFETEVLQAEQQMKKEIDGHVTIAEDALIQISDQIKSLDVCRKSKDDEVMFVGTKKANKLKSKYDLTMSTMQQTMYPIEIRYRPNDVVSDVIQQLDSIGTLESKGHPSLSSQRADSLLHLDIVDKREIDVGKDLIWDCTFMKSGHLVLACDDELLLLDESFNVKSRLSITASGVAAINKDEVIVTQGDEELLRVRMFPQPVVMTTVKMKRKCWGVDVFGDEIYVACDDGEGHGEVQVLNFDGAVRRKVGVQNDGSMFKGIYSVKVSRDGSKIFVSDNASDKVLCLTQQGDVIYQYSDPDLRVARGLYVDEKDTLLVCGTQSSNIHMVDRDGRKVIIWLTQKNGVVYPNCVSYRARDGVLVVGLCNGDKTLVVFSTKLS